MIKLIEKNKVKQIFDLIRKEYNYSLKTEYYSNIIIFTFKNVLLTFKVSFKDNYYILKGIIYDKESLYVVYKKDIYRCKDLTQLYFFIRNYKNLNLFILGLL